MKHIQNSSIVILLAVLKWTANWWFPNIPKADYRLLEWISIIRKMIMNTGVLTAIKRIKCMRLHMTRYISGQPLYRNTEAVSLDREGIPRAIRPIFMDGLDFSNPEHISFVLTCLGCSRAMKAKAIPKLFSITDYGRPLDPRIIQEFRRSALHLLRILRIKPGSIDTTWSMKNIHHSNKAGPQGLATFSAIKDLNSLYTKHTSILESIFAFGGDELQQYMNRLKDSFLSKYSKSVSLKVFSPHRDEDDFTIRKLSVIDDKEGKARIIAILDYWSQTSLKVLHDVEFSLLKKIKEDRTFSQDPHGLNRPNGHSYHSLDLSSATDRFPLTLQRELVGLLCGTEKSFHWERIMVRTKFSVKFDAIPSDWSSVSYNTGQPMGAYSSWSTFALAHHVVVTMASKRVGINPKGLYILLGDDIVISHDGLAKAYVDIMNDLSVEISQSKTHHSKYMYEFAKRWFYLGKEVTGIPLAGICDNIKQYHLIWSSVVELIHQRGMIPRRYISIPDLIWELYSLLPNSMFPTKLVMNIYRKVKTLHYVTRLARDEEVNLEDFRNLLISSLPSDTVSVDTSLEALKQVLRASANHIVMSQMSKLQSTVKDLSSYLYSKFGRIGDQSYVPPFDDLMQVPVARALHERFRTILPKFTSPPPLGGSFRDVLEIIALPDPTKMGESRANVRLVQAQAHLSREFLREFKLRAEGHGSMVVPLTRALVAIQQFALLEKLYYPDRPNPIGGNFRFLGGHGVCINKLNAVLHQDLTDTPDTT